MIQKKLIISEKNCDRETKMIIRNIFYFLILIFFNNLLIFFRTNENKRSTISIRQINFSQKKNEKKFPLFPFYQLQFLLQSDKFFFFLMQKK